MIRWVVLMAPWILVTAVVPATARAQANPPISGQNQATDAVATPAHVLYKGTAFPGEPVTGAYLKSQKLFDAYYDRKDYHAAYDVLLKGLVWRGDKHAQYMLGIMYWYGQGVPSERAKAAAWFRLSAQRGNDLLMKIRDEAWSQLSDCEKQSANQYFAEIKQEYGDRAVIRNLIRRDDSSFRRSLAWHSTAKNGNLDIISGDSNITSSGTELVDAREARINKRLEYLGGYIEYGELEFVDDMSSTDIASNLASDY